uniref:Eukaryotic translation initiation factor 3 subunit J n=2 Tax=Oncorhynchus mykiss TaxID=8022 RepID=A0A8C7URL0_ONCMY
MRCLCSWCGASLWRAWSSSEFCYNSSKRDNVAQILQESGTFGPVQNWSPEDTQSSGQMIIFLPSQSDAAAGSPVLRLQALTGLLSHSLAFGPISSWRPEVFIEVGALAAGLPDMAMSSLVKVEGLTPFWLCPSSGQTSVRIQKHISEFCQTRTHTHTAKMADADDWDADNFEPDVAPIKKAVVLDKWEGEDEDEDVKDNWDDEEEEKKAEAKKSEAKVSEKKKLSEKIKEKENRLRKKQQELKKNLDEEEELTPEQQLAEKLKVQKMQEEADLELAKEAFGMSGGSTTNNVSGIEAMCPSSKEDFTEFEKLLKVKILQYEKSVHYSSFLESLFRELCISLEVEDLKKISSSLTVLLNEKQKQEKAIKGKKKKKGAVLGGGMKAKGKDDLADYGEFDGGYTQDYDDFM